MTNVIFGAMLAHIVFTTGIAETIEWTRALMALDALALDPDSVNLTLGVLLKYQDDIAKLQGSEAARLLAEVKKAAQEPA